MFKNLSPGAIGIKASLQEALQLANASGFEGIDFSIEQAAQLAEEKSADQVQALFQEAGIKPGSWGLPVDFRGTENRWRQGLEQLPQLAQLAQKLGSLRTTIWILPYSDERPFQDNLTWHVKRLGPIAEILKDHECRLGLEFIGPKTLRTGHTYPFIHTLAEMLELAEQIGTGNVGLLLDCWHWYTSHGTLNELEQLTKDQVVVVHVNDAPEGIPIDHQLDNRRCLPGQTGIIDIVGFLTILAEMGYDGPITPEPFSQEVNALPAEESARVTAAALHNVYQQAGFE